MKQALVSLLALSAALAIAGAAQAQTAMEGMDHSQMDHGDMAETNDMVMLGALGPYAMNREASGTAWQPDASPSMGTMSMAGDWMVMNHALFNLVYDEQSGPRGDEKTYAAGMLMSMASRALANGDMVQLRGMFSPDPLMGKSGYPLLLQTGETANGVTHLVDRQHPHDLFMELSASYSHPLGETSSVFGYAGLPGEPAFGPPAFMHRLSAMDSPEAPISHHWLDSSHVTFGVLTAGFTHDGWKLEATRFNGREPDERRYDVETRSLDSTAARVTWNPSSGRLSLQASFADVRSPEALEPEVNQKRWSGSLIYTQPIGAAGWWSSTLAFGRKISGGEALDAWLGETAVHPNDAWTLFARAERVENAELAPGSAQTVSRLSLGAIHDWRLGDQVKLGIGVLGETGRVLAALKASYGGQPKGSMVFLRLKVG